MVINTILQEFEWMKRIHDIKIPVPPIGKGDIQKKEHD